MKNESSQCIKTCCGKLCSIFFRYKDSVDGTTGVGLCCEACGADYAITKDTVTNFSAFKKLRAAKFPQAKL